MRYLHADTLVVGHDVVLSPGWLTIHDDGTVQHVSCDPPSPPPSDGDTVTRAKLAVPGFVSIHCHGLADTDVATAWADPWHTLALQRATGTTATLATLVMPTSATADGGAKAVFPELAAALGVRRPGCGVLEGLHAEGPIVADRGGLPASDATMALPEFLALCDALPGLKVMTIAPSVDEGSGFARTRELLRRGVVPAFGHDKAATEATVMAALKACRAAGGPRPHVTHLYNVMRFHHRLSGLANVALLQRFPDAPLYDGAVVPTVEVIGDQLHVSPLALQLVLTSRDHGDVAFVTDAITSPAVGNTLAYAGQTVEVIPARAHPECPPLPPPPPPAPSVSALATEAATGGVTDEPACVVLAGTTTLAGSCTTMLSMFRLLVTMYRLTPAQASRLCSEAPAGVARLHHLGRLDVGKRADVVCLDPTDNRFNVEAVMVAGHV